MNKTLLLVIISITLFHIKSVAEEFPASSLLPIDTVENNLLQQILTYPQEKIYVQTDKGGYLSGERIWFRAHMQDAFSHKPIFLSRYIYVELINPFDNLVDRVKIRPDSTGVYSGFIDLHDDLSEGSYTIRAYTQYMRNGGEETYAKRNIDVYDPFSLEIEPLLSFDVKNNNANVVIKFVDRQTNDTITPELVSCQLAHKKSKNLKPQAGDGYVWSEKVDGKLKNRTMLLSLKYKDRKYSRFYTIPVESSLFDVSFFPEGGYLVPNIVNQVAFKALNADGWGESVVGSVYNSENEEVGTISTTRHGMGVFGLMPIKGESYYANITNEIGDTKRFDLPAVNSEAITLAARVLGKRMLVAVNVGEDAMSDDLTLLVHQKGHVVYHKPISENSEVYTFPSDEMPNGIINVMLLNSEKDIVSERLLYNINDKHKSSVVVDAGSSSFRRRELVPMSLKLSAGDGQLMSGSVAVSVVDKNSVVQDTSFNIKSYLLLSSELRGHIENPSSYMTGSKADNMALDVLMLTQGWRRYDLPKVLKGDIEVPTSFEPELAQKVKGRSDGLFTALKGGSISLMATLDSLVSTVATESDEKGRFEFDVEYPAGTSILVQSLSKKGGSSNLISLEKETFPDIKGSSLSIKATSNYEHDVDLDAYLQRANEDYMQQFGIRTIMLEDFTVTAQKTGRYEESTYYSPLAATGLKTAEDIEQMNLSSLRSLLYTQPGVIVRSDNVTSTRSDRPILFIIDNVEYDDFADRLDDIDISSIESLFVIRDNSMMPGYYPNTDGAIVITTKIGYTPKSRKPINLDHFVPLGYQKHAEFYSPTYETDEKRDGGVPDLRTTIYWKPNVIFNESGEAQIEFYSADMPTEYLLIGEGVGENGEVVCFEHEVEIVGSSDR